MRTELDSEVIARQEMAYRDRGMDDETITLTRMYDRLYRASRDARHALETYLETSTELCHDCDIHGFRAVTLGDDSTVGLESEWTCGGSSSGLIIYLPNRNGLYDRLYHDGCAIRQQLEDYLAASKEFCAARSIIGYRVMTLGSTKSIGDGLTSTEVQICELQVRPVSTIDRRLLGRLAWYSPALRFSMDVYCACYPWHTADHDPSDIMGYHFLMLGSDLVVESEIDFRVGAHGADYTFCKGEPWLTRMQCNERK
jgi:hypothetical protein